MEGNAKVRGSLYGLVFRALGSSRLAGMSPSDQARAASHVARKLGGAYVKTKAGWTRRLRKGARNHVEMLRAQQEELVELRAKLRVFNQHAEALARARHGANKATMEIVRNTEFFMRAKHEHLLRQKARLARRAP